MLKLHTLILLLGLIALAFACAPHVQRQQHGYCEYYVDGTSDTSSSRRKRDSSSDSDSSGSGESSGSGGSGGGGGKKFNRSKKKKDVKCYKYEDGTKDDGAVLNEGVKEIDITITTKKT